MIKQPIDIDKLIAMQPTEECSINCLRDKVSARLDAGGLSKYDEKRLKKRYKELKKQYDKEMAAIEEEMAAEGVK
jgi:hypothetical protein